MFYGKVRTPDDAIAYLTDCTMATVCSMAMKKRRPAYEYSRQISIAQKAVDWMKEFNIDTAGTRADKLNGRSVKEWAAEFEPNP